MVINILGSKWSLINRNYEDDILFQQDVLGYTDQSTKTIVIVKNRPNNPHMYNNLDPVVKETIRHEIIHAFLDESGLCECTKDNWARNEEMIDWFAIQFPKIVKAMNKAKALEVSNE